MTEDNLFRPYKVIQQTNSSLELKSGINPRIVRITLIAMPLVFIVVGLILFTTQSNSPVTYTMMGVGLLELFLFSFLKFPADLRMDSMGFVLKQVSIKGIEVKDFLWSDVDRIRWRHTRTKNGSVLTFDAVLKEGKKLRLLNFPAYNPKKQSAAEISSVLSQISRKPVSEK